MLNDRACDISTAPGELDWRLQNKNQSVTGKTAIRVKQVLRAVERDSWSLNYSLSYENAVKTLSY
jgi:hypothetical protein